MNFWKNKTKKNKKKLKETKYFMKDIYFLIIVSTENVSVDAFFNLLQVLLVKLGNLLCTSDWTLYLIYGSRLFYSALKLRVGS